VSLHQVELSKCETYGSFSSYSTGWKTNIVFFF